MRRAHLIVGVMFLIVFPATGAYMRLTFPEAHQGDPIMRMSFRSAHVYILLTALLNVMLGLHLQPTFRVAATRLQTVGSWCLMLVPAIMTVAFFFEPGPGVLLRPIVLPGLLVALLGTTLHMAARRLETRHRSAPRNRSWARRTLL
jgi:hypothetical protein